MSDADIKSIAEARQLLLEERPRGALNICTSLLKAPLEDASVRFQAQFLKGKAQVLMNKPAKAQKTFMEASLTAAAGAGSMACEADMKELHAILATTPSETPRPVTTEQQVETSQQAEVEPSSAPVGRPIVTLGQLNEAKKRLDTAPSAPPTLPTLVCARGHLDNEMPRLAIKNAEALLKMAAVDSVEILMEAHLIKGQACTRMHKAKKATKSFNAVWCVRCSRPLLPLPPSFITSIAFNFYYAPSLAPRSPSIVNPAPYHIHLLSPTTAAITTLHHYHHKYFSG